MLKITRKVEYALIAVRHLQNSGTDRLVPAKEIARQYCIPHELLSKTLQKLSKKKIIQSVKGPTGGYRFRSKSNNVNMKNFIEILEGPVGLMDCYFDSDCIQLNSCNIRNPINQINDSIRLLLEKMTLADFAN